MTSSTEAGGSAPAAKLPPAVIGGYNCPTGKYFVAANAPQQVMRGTYPVASFGGVGNQLNVRRNIAWNAAVIIGPFGLPRPSRRVSAGRAFKVGGGGHSP